MYFEIIGEIENIEEIAAGGRIRESCGFRSSMEQVDGVNSRGWPWFGFRVARSARLNCIGMKPTVSAKRR